MTEYEIQKLLLNRLQLYIAVPNNKNMFAFESDVLAITKSNYLIEYEIKLTKSDFKRDISKYAYRSGKKMNRYEYLLSGRGANRFYYVIPEGMVPLHDIPEFAGVIHISKKINSLTKEEVLITEIIRKPKLLHDRHITHKQVLAIARSLTFRAFK